MVRNQEKYDQALQLRKRGFTLQEIAKYCDISKSTASKWLQNKAFSDHVTKQNRKRAGADNAKRLQLVNKARGGERKARYAEAARSAAVEYKHYKKDPLFMAGLTVYLSIGDTKDQRSIRLSSARMPAHAVFVRFAREYLGIEKSRVHIWLQLYHGQSEEVCMKKWRTVTTLPYSQFYKNQVINSTASKKTLHYGVGNTIIGSTVLKCKLNRWIELVLQDLQK
ncbi:MAG: helix-turn-helix domain-containing protein [Candidatus Kaiserbacteria bacterium]|nr:helix-turn-helix domain-containing protein [Candidatus Kaiserbacteria bacterium]